MAVVVQAYYAGGRTPNRSQAIFAGAYPDCSERFFLGTPGCGKTSSLIAEVNRHASSHPGSVWLLARYSERETLSILRGDFLRETPRELLGTWIADEGKQMYANGSAVILVGLKPSEGQAPYSKFAGMNLSGVALSQVESIPQDVVEKLRERLRHPIGPRLLLAEGNLDVGVQHWLRSVVASARQVAERVHVSGPRLVVIGNLDDNSQNLPPEYVAKMRADYPPGHPEHGPKIAGAFGTPILGAPVYGDVFKPELHVMEFEALPSLPVYESFDFGLTRPAIVWAQWFPGGCLRILGEYLGDGTNLGDVVLERNRLWREWFPRCKTIYTTADPSGIARKDTGPSSVAFLRQYNIHPMIRPQANTLPARIGAIQSVSNLMSRRTKQGEAFGMHPRCRVLAEGFRSGYVRDANRGDGAPLKDGYFDHLQNALEYLVYGFGDLSEDADAQGTHTLRELLRSRDPGEPREDDEDYAQPTVGASRGWRQTGY